jgi:hypothetical protein
MSVTTNNQWAKVWAVERKIEWGGKSKIKLATFTDISQDQHLVTTHNYFIPLRQGAVHRKCALLLDIHIRIL